MDHPTVAVLMSTYNGEKYIKEQIESILAQRCVSVQLIIRDDGSQDNTLSICREYLHDHSNIKVFQGDNKGVGRSFMQLLRIDIDTDYYCFADQDDIWLKDKLIRAVDMIRAAEGTEEHEKYRAQKGPVLYVSNQILVDANLNRIGMRFYREPRHDLIQTISTNDISGCTMVMNRELREIIIANANRPSDSILSTRLHDTWVMIVAQIFGKVVYDDEGWILYRQHDKNVVGAKKMSLFKRIIDKFKRLITGKYKGNRSRLARYLLSRFKSNMVEDEVTHLMIIAQCNSFKGACKFMGDEVVRKVFSEPAPVLFLKCITGWV